MTVPLKLKRRREERLKWQYCTEGPFIYAACGVKLCSTWPPKSMGSGCRRPPPSDYVKKLLFERVLSESMKKTAIVAHGTTYTGGKGRNLIKWRPILSPIIFHRVGVLRILWEVDFCADHFRVFEDLSFFRGG